MELKDIIKSEIVALIGIVMVFSGNINVYIGVIGYIILVTATATLIYREYGLSKKFGLKSYSYNFREAR